MTPPALPLETLAALAAAARELAPPYFDVSVDVCEEHLRVVVGHTRLRVPAYGGGRWLGAFGPEPGRLDAIAAWVPGAVQYCVEGVMLAALRPYREQRERAREAWRLRDTRANADAYREACTEFELESARLFGTYIPERVKS